MKTLICSLYFLPFYVGDLTLGYEGLYCGAIAHHGCSGSFNFFILNIFAYRGIDAFAARLWAARFCAAASIIVIAGASEGLFISASGLPLYLACKEPYYQPVEQSSDIWKSYYEYYKKEKKSH